MELKTKKFIAREGLTLILGYLFCGIMWALGTIIVTKVGLSLEEIPLFLLVVLITTGILYALYWGIRFIIWAVKTLKQKEEKS